MVAAQPDPATPAYTFDNDDPAAAERLALSSAVLDGFTISRLVPLGELTGRRCLELGAGNGNVAGWLADQAGPTGQVLATDINIRHIPADRGYRVVRHDLTRDPASSTAPGTSSTPSWSWYVPGRHEILVASSGAGLGGTLAIEEWEPYRAGYPGRLGGRGRASCSIASRPRSSN